MALVSYSFRRRRIKWMEFIIWRKEKHIKSVRTICASGVSVQWFYHYDLVYIWRNTHTGKPACGNVLEATYFGLDCADELPLTRFRLMFEWQSTKLVAWLSGPTSGNPFESRGSTFSHLSHASSHATGLSLCHSKSRRNQVSSYSSLQSNQNEIHFDTQISLCASTWCHFYVCVAFRTNTCRQNIGK